MSRTKQESHFSSGRTGVEGALLAFAPVPFMFLLLVPESFSFIRLNLAILSSSGWLAGALTLLRYPRVGKPVLAVASFATFFVLFPYSIRHPAITLLLTIAQISFCFLLKDLEVVPNRRNHQAMKELPLRRLRAALNMLPYIVFLHLFLGLRESFGSAAVVFASFLIMMLLLLDYLRRSPSLRYLLLMMGAILWTGCILLFHGYSYLSGSTFIVYLLLVFSLPKSGKDPKGTSYLWELTEHPARLLFSSFLSLCLLGTLLLLFPISSSGARLQIIDAAFTAVSAVCVTGLVVLDTATDFSWLGQFFIVLLIQLGGLGIMTITTVGYHFFGRRMSLRQESLMTSVTETGHRELFESLILIVKFTFLVEASGALLLWSFFWFSGIPFWSALGHALFTAVSAFCNAGFMMTSTNLIPYQTNPFILHTVALLIILGGMAPATCLLIPAWLRKKTIPIASRIALIGTAFLMISGTIFILICEWNGILTGLSFGDKIHNAWFQSATLRTAGFNSVDLGLVSDPVCLMMIVFMFIGGSPGGTAGGVKTTTIGVLLLTFWANILQRDDVVIQNRRVSQNTINRAVTIVISVLFGLGLGVLLLEMTQMISTREIVFEVASALGTVGLSIGATPLLDEIGKIAIMSLMFIGRIGPMTLFMFLSQNKLRVQNDCPDAHISL